MTTQNSKRKPRKFDASAKVLFSTAAVAALVGGWNAIGHLDSAKAAAPSTTTTGAQPEVAPITESDSAVLAALGVQPLPTLAPASAVLANTGSALAQNAGALQLPDIPTLQPLQPLDQLPSVPMIQMPAGGFAGVGRVSRGS